MNGFHHLPEYASAATAYRAERVWIERTPRRDDERPSLLRRLAAALPHRPLRATRPAVR